MKRHFPTRRDLQDFPLSVFVCERCGERLTVRSILLHHRMTPSKKPFVAQCCGRQMTFVAQETKA